MLRCSKCGTPYQPDALTCGRSLICPRDASVFTPGPNRDGVSMCATCAKTLPGRRCRWRKYAPGHCQSWERRVGERLAGRQLAFDWTGDEP